MVWWNVVVMLCHCLWASGGQSKIFWGNVLLCPRLDSSIEYVKYALPAHTFEADIIKGVLLETSYLSFMWPSY